MPSSRLQEKIAAGLHAIDNAQDTVAAVKVLFAKLRELKIPEEVVLMVQTALLDLSPIASVIGDVQVGLFFRQVDGVMSLCKEKYGVDIDLTTAVEYVRIVRSGALTKAMGDSVSNTVSGKVTK